LPFPDVHGGGRASALATAVRHPDAGQHGLEPRAVGGPAAGWHRGQLTDFHFDVLALFDELYRQLTVGASTGTHARLPLLTPGGSASAQSAGEADWSQAH
jgi:hypothetical protein